MPYSSQVDGNKCAIFDLERSHLLFRPGQSRRLPNAQRNVPSVEGVAATRPAADACARDGLRRSRARGRARGRARRRPAGPNPPDRAIES
jgi:hypothetical protein